MKGSLSEFAQKVNTTTKAVLKSYTLEVELALGPAKVTLRAVPDPKKLKEQLQQEDNER